jgi:hypothetical protein
MPGLIAVWADVTLPFCNAVVLSSPIVNRGDLERRVATFEAFLATKNSQPMFLVCQDWLGDDVRPVADEIIAAARLRPAIPLYGMVADQVLPAVRQLPHLEYKRVSDQYTRNRISDINSAAYGFPLEYGREAFASPEAWRGEGYGYVGYADGEPVAAAATSVLDQRLYVGFVATLPHKQKRGYAEAVMRYSLSEAQKATGIQRSLLHATKEGYPIYLRMGYRETARFMGYVRSEGQ